MRRRRLGDNTPRNSTFSLNITSMTDMFTILLVFLLQTYSTAEIQVVPDQGMKLPLSNVELNPIKSVQVSLSKADLKIEDRKIASLANQDFNRADVDPNDSNFILPLFNELDKMAKAEKAKKEAFDAGTSPVKPDLSILEGKILMKADADLPYQVLRKVMYTASMAGFPKLKLATVVGQ